MREKPVHENPDIGHAPRRGQSTERTSLPPGDYLIRSPDAERAADILATERPVRQVPEPREFLGGIQGARVELAFYPVNAWYDPNDNKIASFGAFFVRYFRWNEQTSEPEVDTSNFNDPEKVITDSFFWYTFGPRWPAFYGLWQPAQSESDLYATLVYEHIRGNFPQQDSPAACIGGTLLCFQQQGAYDPDFQCFQTSFYMQGHEKHVHMKDYGSTIRKGRWYDSQNDKDIFHRSLICITASEFTVGGKLEPWT